MKNVITLSVSMLFAFMALFSWSYIFPVHLKDLGASDGEIGIVYTIFGLSLTLFQIFGGMLADRFGRKLMIVLPAFMNAPLTALLLHTESWSVAALLFALIGVFGALQFPSFNAVLAESTTKRRRAFIWFEAALSFGAAFGPLGGAFLLARPDAVNPFNLASSMDNLFALSAILSLVAAFVVLIALQETKSSRGQVHVRLRLSDILKPNIKWFIISASFGGLVLSISLIGPFITLHLEDVLGFSNSKINEFWAIGWGVAAILSLFGEQLIHKIGSKAVLMWSVLLHAVALLVWALMGSHPLQIVPFMIAFLMGQFVLVGNHMMIAALTTPENRGRIGGLIGSFVGIVRSFGPVIAMEARIAMGFWLPFALALVWGVLSFGTLIPCKVREDEEENNAVPSP